MPSFRRAAAAAAAADIGGKQNYSPVKLWYDAAFLKNQSIRKLELSIFLLYFCIGNYIMYYSSNYLSRTVH
jgi:hypothetical protein